MSYFEYWQWFVLIPFAVYGVSTLIQRIQIARALNEQIEDADAIAITDIDHFGGQIKFMSGMYTGMYVAAVTEKESSPIRNKSHVVVVRHDRENSQFVVKLANS